MAMFVAIPLMAAAPPGGTTIYVDDDNCPDAGSGTERDPYCSIQTAINAAVNGDEVIVAEGVYFENINFNGKAITLRSTDPLNPAVVAATIINGGGSGASSPATAVRERTRSSAAS